MDIEPSNPQIPSERKDRVTISLSHFLVDLLDHRVDGFTIRSRSQAVETLLYDALGVHAVLQAVFLAGGQNPADRKDALLSTTRAIKQAGIHYLLLITGHWGENLLKQVTAGELAGISLDLAKSELGDAGAVKENKNHLIGKAHLVVNTTAWPLGLDLNDLIHSHQQNVAVATACITNPETGEGVYIFAPDIFRYIANGSFQMFKGDVFPELEKYGLINYYEIPKTEGDIK